MTPPPRPAAPLHLRFESSLAVAPEALWTWATSIEGISAELRPWLRMTAPRRFRSLRDLPARPGRLFRSYLLFLGVLPVDFSELTLRELVPGAGFVEESPMGSMRLWRHERRIAADGARTRLIDELEFEPRFARPVIAWFVRSLFAHRHARLRREFAGR